MREARDEGHMDYGYIAGDDDDGEMEVYGPIITVDLEDLLERTADENGNAHLDVPDWWMVHSGRWVAYQAGVISHMSEDGVGQYVTMAFGFPAVDDDGTKQLLIKAVSFQDDEQIAVFMAGLFGALAELGGQWDRKMKIIDRAIGEAMERGEW